MKRLLIIGGLIAVTPGRCREPLYASSAPDGLNKVAEDHARRQRARVGYRLVPAGGRPGRRMNDSVVRQRDRRRRGDGARLRIVPI